MPDIPDKNLYTAQDLATVFGVHIDTVRRWLREKRVHYVDMPKGKRIPYSEFHYIIKNGPRARRL